MENFSVSGDIHIHNHYHFNIVLPDGTPAALVKGIHDQVAAFDAVVVDRQLSQLSQQELRKLRRLQSENAALRPENERLNQAHLQNSVRKMEFMYQSLQLDVFASSRNAILPTDPASLAEFRGKLEEYLLPLTSKEEPFTERDIFALPRVAIRSAWYRFTQRHFGNVLGTPPNVRSRFNSPDGLNGGFRTIAMAEDVVSALFELSVHRGLDDAFEILQQIGIVRIEVTANNIVDLRDSKATQRVLGIGTAELQTLSTTKSESVLQRLCRMLVRAGFSGAIVPSVLSIGKSQLVLFPDNFQERDGVEVFSTSSFLPK